MSRDSFETGLEALGAFESGRPSGDPEQYRVQNTLGFTGKYQFGEALLIDLGYYQADTFYGAGAATNLWQGTWTAKAQAFGVNSIEDFRNSPEIQEAAIRDAFEFNWKIIETQLGNAGKTVDDFIGKTITFNDRGTQKSVTFTPFGMLAGAHLRGPYGLANLLLNGSVSYDEYGTSILRYVDEYAGYDVPDDITGGGVVNPPIEPPTIPTEPVEPIAPDPVIPSSGNALEGTDGVQDVFGFTWNWGTDSVIKNFNVTEDIIDLKKFWLPDSKQVKIFDDSQGNTVIDLKEVNNQTITLQGVSKSQLTANNFQGLPDASTVLNNPSTPPTNPPTTPSVPTLSINTTSVVEGDSGKSNAVFTVELSAASDKVITVNYQTVDGNADSMTDFVAKTGTLTFAPGETSKTISIEVNGDTTVEKSEDFYVELDNAVNATILDGRGDAIIVNDDSNNPTTPTNPPTTPSNGQVVEVNENGADVLNFNPAKDQIDFGGYSVHSMIITETSRGVTFDNPWNDNEQTLVGISLKDLSVDNFKTIRNNHLREDVGGALAWETGNAVIKPNTVYVRSHQVGLREAVDFNAATDKISFLYYGNRERLTINDTPQGVEISNSATNQSLILKNTKIADLSSSNFEFHFSQVREDGLASQLGFSVTNDQIVSRDGILDPGGSVDYPTMPHIHPDGHNHPDPMPSPDPMPNPDPIDPSADYIGVDGQRDIFSFTWNWGKESTISNFTPGEDSIDLKNFWTNY
ncbi:MAG: Calx-beta domain-containing protein, partial [Xenococcaceae cyanobacterium MO_188.B19]|nr:Calx-beta domain-containing protein [Xenococcaceae cyanobacterium MO_188.B19]